MITDLERNDLGRVCEYGSVRVAELLKLERFSQVFHLVSSIEGQLKLGNDHINALSACFPGGSISGAPKFRALQIIEELESSPRGLYTGAIGYLGANWESQFSIAIRTGIIQSGKLSFHVGAGIVADSDPLAEYEETLHKAAGFFAAAAAKNEDMCSVDVCSAFCTAPINRTVYIDEPKQYKRNGYVCVLGANMYGLVSAPAAYHKDFDKFLASCMIRPDPSDTCLYTSHNPLYPNLQIIEYSDDLIIKSSKAEIDRFKQDLTSKYEIRDF